MNFFCRLLGHTWVVKSEDPKIRWTTEPKSLSRLELTADGEPSFFRECARCHAREAIAAGAGSVPAASSGLG